MMQARILKFGNESIQKQLRRKENSVPLTFDVQKRLMQIAARIDEINTKRTTLDLSKSRAFYTTWNWVHRKNGNKMVPLK